MYSPPAIPLSGTNHERSDSSQQPHLLSQPSSAPAQKAKLPSLPPFPSLVSSLGGRHSGSSPEMTASPLLQRDAPAHSSYPSQYSFAHPHHYQESPPESATRSGWPAGEGTATAQDSVTSRTASANSTLLSSSGSAPPATTNTSAIAKEERKAGLPLPVGYSDHHPYRGGSHSHSHHFANGMLSGIPGNGPGQLERESSIRTGSSASTSEPPLSPRHTSGAGAEKRRRLSAAHEIYPHTTIHADDTHEHAQMVDELSPMPQGTESASPTGDDQKGANGRTLKQTKRAAQNRAAQQAFRKRKEERIKELEEKEKVLNALVARENEIIRKERLLAERELAFARHSNNSSNNVGGTTGLSGPSSSTQQTGGEASSIGSPSAGTATNDWDRAFASAPVASPVQHIAERLEASNRANEALRSENESLKDRLMDQSKLIESLRRSLEDLGGENRNLRDAIRNQALELQAQHATAVSS